jgi:isopentenyl-diphosphate delta-isomerase
MENELCPVYAAYAGPAPFSSEPDPAEVAEIRWVNWEDFCEAARSGRQPVSPWCAMQLAELAALGPKPLDWVPADPAGLPPAARGWPPRG